LPYDHYHVDLNRVFELSDPAIRPDRQRRIPSRRFQARSDWFYNAARGTAGAIRQIIFSVIASDEKYRLLLEGGLDIVRNNLGCPDETASPGALRLRDGSLQQSGGKLFPR
jgi:hypothetical protein